LGLVCALEDSPLQKKKKDKKKRQVYEKEKSKATQRELTTWLEWLLVELTAVMVTAKAFCPWKKNFFF